MSRLCPKCDAEIALIGGLFAEPGMKHVRKEEDGEDFVTASGVRLKAKEVPRKERKHAITAWRLHKCEEGSDGED